MNITAFAEALKPFPREVVREEVMQRVTDLEIRVDKADELIQGLQRLDPKVHDLESDVVELRKVASLEASMASARASSPGWSSLFVPGFIEVKGGFAHGMIVKRRAS